MYFLRLRKTQESASLLQIEKALIVHSFQFWASPPEVGECDLISNAMSLMPLDASYPPQCTEEWRTMLLANQTATVEWI